MSPELPVTVPLLTVELKQVLLSDEEPTPAEGYKILLIEDLTWTKLWLEYKVT